MSAADEVPGRALRVGPYLSDSEPAPVVEPQIIDPVAANADTQLMPLVNTEPAVVDLPTIRGVARRVPAALPAIGGGSREVPPSVMATLDRRKHAQSGEPSPDPPTDGSPDEAEPSVPPVPASSMPAVLGMPSPPPAPTAPSVPPAPSESSSEPHGPSDPSYGPYGPVEPSSGPYGPSEPSEPYGPSEPLEPLEPYGPSGITSADGGNPTSVEEARAVDVATPPRGGAPLPTMHDGDEWITPGSTDAQTQMIPFVRPGDTAHRTAQRPSAGEAEVEAEDVGEGADGTAYASGTGFDQGAATTAGRSGGVGSGDSWADAAADGQGEAEADGDGKGGDGDGDGRSDTVGSAGTVAVVPRHADLGQTVELARAMADYVRPGPGAIEADTWDTLAPSANEDYQGRRRSTPGAARRWLLIVLIILAVAAAIGGTVALALSGRSDASGPGGTGGPNDPFVAPGVTASVGGSEGGQLVPPLSSRGASPSAPAASSSRGVVPTGTATSVATEPTTSSAVTSGFAGGFSAVTLQAEAATLSGSWQSDNNPTCSAGTPVVRTGKWSEFSSTPGTVTFSNVTVPTAGSYVMTIYYVVTTAGTRSVEITVNGASVSTAPFSSGCLVARAVTVTLRQGANVVKFANPTDRGPSVDRIVISSA